MVLSLSPGRGAAPRLILAASIVIYSNVVISVGFRFSAYAEMRVTEKFGDDRVSGMQCVGEMACAMDFVLRHY
jgi:hypothetical protein